MIKGFASLLAGCLVVVSTVLSQELASVGEIPVPAEYQRIDIPDASFSEWIQNLPLKPNKTIIAFDSSRVNRSYYNVFAVLDMPLLFDIDLEQCADYCMRLWAEYHKGAGKLDRFYLFDYSGERVMFSGSGRNFMQFLRHSMAYSNSHSLKTGCIAIDSADLKPGDMVVQNRDGGIGHVSMILDACEDSVSNKLFLIGFGFMPAQEFHIEMANDRYGVDGWFTVDGYYRFLDDTFDFGKPVLRRFDDQ